MINSMSNIMLIILPMSMQIKMMRRMFVSKGMVRAMARSMKVMILIEMFRSLNTNIIAWKFITDININKIISQSLLLLEEACVLLYSSMEIYLKQLQIMLELLIFNNKPPLGLIFSWILNSLLMAKIVNKITLSIARMKCKASVCK